MGKNIWNNLKKWLGVGVLAGGLMLPLTAKGDGWKVGVVTSDSSVGYRSMNQAHGDGAEELYDTDWDVPWSTGPPPPSQQKWLKADSRPYEIELYTDGRPP